MARTVDRLDRSQWAVAATLAIAGAGIAAGSQFLIVAATLPLWYLGAAVLGTRERAQVRVSRAVHVGDSDSDGDDATAPERGPDDSGRNRNDTPSGDPGDTVTVRTTVQNVGSEPVVDLRLVDGVPEPLPVVDGSPRACVSLDALESATVEYELELRRGAHSFDEPTVRTRDLTGTVVETWSVETTGDDAVRCFPPVERVPLGGGTNDYAGEVPTDEGGSGVEFYSVREYEPGDPVGSIDWRRYAGTRELTTVEYRAERATRIVCVVDARRNQFRAASRDRLSAAELSADAAERTFEALVDAGHPTGVVGLGDRNVESVPPGTDAATRQTATALLRDTRAANRLGSTRNLSYWTRTIDPFDGLEQQLPGEAQVYLFSSFLDDAPVELVERLRARGYSVRVVSPDVTDADDAETRLEALERRSRLARARAVGARVVDWDLERSIGTILRNAIGGVSTR
ncbi:hypothetical protein C446_10800 [Halobiforma nitratireducens JCM 10879]|uniref:DUF58 domain-containing protein n=2 Tax=Halobiforma nitratireducens TaxID=130048 RepID=M0LYA4_9EURY|nr:hypothetical protein C446_10800 [Halobiforma nitratireducens JCM 10879]